VHLVGTSATAVGRVGMLARGWRWSLRARVAQHPRYSVIARMRHGIAAATDETELVIDGFPRSGNTFAVVAFQLAQPNPVRVSHHIHSPGHIRTAVMRGTPVMLTARQPRDAVVSCVIREPYVSLKQALRAYTTFYESLLSVRDRVVVADFDQITTDMGSVIDRINERFDTRFAAFAHTIPAASACFEIIEHRARRPMWDEHIGAFLGGTETVAELRQAAQRCGADGADPRPVPEDRVARPSASRQGRRGRMLQAYEARALAGVRAAAESVYAQLAITDQKLDVQAACQTGIDAPAGTLTSSRLR